MWKERLRADFQLALIVLFGAITVVGVTPFAIRRLAQGQTLAGVLDLTIIACIAAAATIAWRTGRTRSVSIFLAISYSLGCVAIAHIADLSGVLWVYPVLVANFLLTTRVAALVISATAISAIALSDAALPDVTLKLGFVVSASVVSLFSFVFAARAAAQHARLETLAMRDPLTGAHNRRGLDDELRAAMAQSIHGGQPLGLLVFDLDHFKQVNDTYGHLAGDDVLRRLADLVRANTRMADRFFRIGGEEFSLVLPGVTAASLHDIGEKLRMAVEREIRCGERPITISVGAAPFRADESAAQWLARADAAMYEAKRQGRNRTVLDEGG